MTISVDTGGSGPTNIPVEEINDELLVALAPGDPVAAAELRRREERGG